MALSELDIATKWNNEIKFYKFVETLFYGYFSMIIGTVESLLKDSLN